MKVLVTGSSGMLAQAVSSEFRQRGHEVVALDHSTLDVTDRGEVASALGANRPDVVVQCAAYTDVDGAEAQPELAGAVNGRGAANVAAVCQEIGALFVYPSTDYVFPGDSERPWRPADEPDPVNAYGASKLIGERAALAIDSSLVVRTSWLYGAGGKNFVDTIARLARERDRLEVVDDQIGRPTWTGSLAQVIAKLVESGRRGIFHASDGGAYVSWFALAAEILHIEALSVPLFPVGTEAAGRPAKRPRYSVLDCTETERAVGEPMQDWRAVLRAYLGRSGAGRLSPGGSMAKEG
ncbi:MAG: dTDP-4-dehydrorhamnose reductase [Gemmatimonadota bacterium]